MIEDPRTRFTATTENYRRYRPDYPASLFDWILGFGEGRDAVDLGAGTGIASRQLAERGFRVTGVEPNDAMRAAATEAGGGPTYVTGEAAATGLPAASADLVIAAQAFHWFPLAPTLAEVDRVLRPGGSAVAFWNIRDTSDPCVAAYTALLARYSVEVDKVPKGLATIGAIRARVPGARTRTFRNGQRLDREGLHGRAWSSSYVAHGVADAEGFRVGLDALFDRFEQGGTIEMAYRVEAVRFRGA